MFSSFNISSSKADLSGTSDPTDVIAAGAGKENDNSNKITKNAVTNGVVDVNAIPSKDERAIKQFRSGDYQLQLHIIEGIEFISPSGDSFVKPVISIEAFQQHIVHTKQKPAGSSAIFDEYFRIALPNMTPAQLEDGCILIEAIDASTNVYSLTHSKNLIGSFEIDAHAIYDSSNHEIYRQWMPVFDSKELKLSGKILLTLELLGPKDTPKIHDRAEELAEEKKQRKKNGENISSIFSNLKPFPQKLSFLVVEFFRIEDFIPLGKTFLFGNDHEFFISVDFDKNNNACIPDFKMDTSNDIMTALWIPFMDPTFSSKITIRLFEKHSLSNLVIATAVSPLLNYRAIIESKLSSRTLDENNNSISLHSRYHCFWANFYGPPDPNNHANEDVRLEMAKFPSIATCYKGRMMVRVYREEDAKKSNGERRAAKVFTTSLPNNSSSSTSSKKQLNSSKKSKSQTSSSADNSMTTKDILSTHRPSQKTYTLRAMVFAGQGFPEGYYINTKPTFSIEVRILHVKVTTVPISVNGGYCWWKDPMALPIEQDVELPCDISMIPDLFVYLILNSSKEPICYKRYNTQELLQRPESEHFGTDPSWIQLKSDKAYGYVTEDLTPGSVLIRLGFGTKDQANKTVWNAISPPKHFNCQLNVHLYRGKGLSPSDSNGLLDPFVMVNLGSSNYKSKEFFKNRDPMFYQTIPFNCSLPEDDFLKPHLYLKVFDQDQFSGDDFVGLVRIELTNKLCLPPVPVDTELLPIVEDPQWYQLTDKSGNPILGQLLVGLQIIKIMQNNNNQILTSMMSTSNHGNTLSNNNNSSKIIASPPLKPSTKPWQISIIILGLRNLKPSGLIPIEKPYIKITLNNVDLLQLPVSRKPNPNNPNYCYSFQEIVMLADNPIFAPNLNVTVKDKRNWLTNSILGTSFVPLDIKMSQTIINNSYNHKRFRSGNPDIALGELIEQEMLDINQKNRNENNLSHNNQNNLLRNRNQSNQLIEIASYLKDRDFVESELENVLGECPFEFYNITTGSAGGAYFDTPFSKVGLLKCTISLTPIKSSDSVYSPRSNKINNLTTEEQLIHSSISKPELVKIRIYILRAIQLTAKDNDNLSDPYLIVQLENEKYSTKDRHKNNTINPKFHEFFEIQSLLPGSSELLITVMDHNDFKPDSLIGATVIDIEDRWLSLAWRELGKGASPEIEPKRPVEKRSLWNPSTCNPQGTLVMWVDIYTIADSKKFPPMEIKPADPEEWEIRLVVWTASDIPPGDPFEDMNDLYFKCIMRDAQQSTDCHLRLVTGQKGSFNWRMKFPIQLPLNSDEEGLARIVIQAWDQDVITTSDCLGEAMLDLTEFFEISAATRKNRKAEGKSEISYHYFPEGSYQPDNMFGSSNLPNTDNNQFCSCLKTLFNWCCCCCPINWCKKRCCCCCNWKWKCCQCCSCFKNCSCCDNVRGCAGSYQCCRWFCCCGFWRKTCCCCYKIQSNEDNNNDIEMGGHGKTREDESSPLIRDQNDNRLSTVYQSYAEQHEQTEQNNNDVLSNNNNKNNSDENDNNIKKKKKKKLTIFDKYNNSQGVNASKYPNVGKIDLKYKGEDTGHVIISIELLPKTLADRLPAGLGRSEPNLNPTLEEPEGRIDFTKFWNPLYILKVIMGERLCAGMGCVLILILSFVALIYIGQPMLTMFMALQAIVGVTFAHYFSLFILISMVLCFWYIRRRVTQQFCTPATADDKDL
eukprot:gene8250-11165_t